MGKELALLLTALGIAAAWVGFADHPTAKSLRKAIVTTVLGALG